MSKEDVSRSSINSSVGTMTGVEHLGGVGVNTNMEAHRDSGHLPEVTDLSYVEVMAHIHHIKRDWKATRSMAARQ